MRLPTHSPAVDKWGGTASGGVLGGRVAMNEDSAKWLFWNLQWFVHGLRSYSVVSGPHGLCHRNRSPQPELDISWLGS